jgi:sulfide:quinone oxidoreductase
MLTLTPERDHAQALDGDPFEVLIAGAGPAGVEAASVLQHIAGDRVRTTIVAPEERFAHLPPAVLSPFAAGGGRLALDRLTGAFRRRGTIVSVDPDARAVRLQSGEVVAYDALLIAVGGIPRSPYPRALAFGTPGSEERMHGLVQDLEDGYVKRVAFVVPPAASWPLPLYELALLTAARAFDMCVDVELTLVTSEPSPLAVFGEAVSDALTTLLADAGVTVRCGVEVAAMPRPNVLDLSFALLEVDRVVTVPELIGPAIEGLPHDPAGFLPVDAYGRVTGAPGVYAAGDATDFEIKQGGIACQQADAAAEAIAACAGVAIDPQPFSPVLRGLLRTEHDALSLQRVLSERSGEGPDGEADRPPTKFVGRELSRLLRDVPVRG